MADLVLGADPRWPCRACLLYVRGCERSFGRDEIGETTVESLRERQPNGDDYGRQHRRAGDRGGANGSIRVFPEKF